MLLTTLREEVLEANLELVRRGLVLYTFGNASGISRKDGLIVIKPSGVAYESLTPEHMVVKKLDGQIVEGERRPSAALLTHLEIYKQFTNVGGVAHTHSEFATAWAQACRPIPCFGTTHDASFHDEVPVTRCMTPDEIASDYEKNTGSVICRHFNKVDPDAVPAVLVAGHGPFGWGGSAALAAHNAVILESVARMAYYTLTIAPDAKPIASHL